MTTDSRQRRERWQASYRGSIAEYTNTINELQQNYTEEK